MRVRLLLGVPDTYAKVAQLARASGSYPGGWRFDSTLWYQSGRFPKQEVDLASRNKLRSNYPWAVKKGFATLAIHSLRAASLKVAEGLAIMPLIPSSRRSFLIFYKKNDIIFIENKKERKNKMFFCIGFYIGYAFWWVVDKIQGKEE